MAWPGTLPAPFLSGYELQATDSTIRTDMDAGAARVRRRFTMSLDRLALKFFLTDAQMITFRAYYDAEMQQGAAWVQIPVNDGRTGATVNKDCRPTSPFKASRLENKYWMVELPVETR